MHGENVEEFKVYEVRSLVWIQKVIFQIILSINKACEQ